MELAKEHGLTPDHIRAIQATGVSDVGKATKFQNGTGRNSLEVQQLAAEAKAALSGCSGEFTFAQEGDRGVDRLAAHSRSRSGARPVHGDRDKP